MNRFIFVFLAAFACFSSAHAERTRLAMIGGDGGRYFEHVCPTGSVLVGVRGYTGLWIDNVQALCARMDRAGPLDALASGPAFGGAQGQTNNSYTCPSGTVIYSFGVHEVADRHVLGRLVFTCRDAFTLESVGNIGRFEGSGDKKFDGFWRDCPSGTVAVGMRGRAGTYLDAFGLVCDVITSIADVPIRAIGKTTREPPPRSAPQPKIDAKTASVRQSGVIDFPRVRGCKDGFVHRLARPDDKTCVPPESQKRTADENARANERRDPHGAYGPNTCIAGFVWREAFQGDTVCVTPEVRALVRQENAQAANRSVVR